MEGWMGSFLLLPFMPIANTGASFHFLGLFFFKGRFCKNSFLDEKKSSGFGKYSE